MDGLGLGGDPAAAELQGGRDIEGVEGVADEPARPGRRQPGDPLEGRGVERRDDRVVQLGAAARCQDLDDAAVVLALELDVEEGATPGRGRWRRRATGSRRPRGRLPSARPRARAGPGRAGASRRGAVPGRRRTIAGRRTRGRRRPGWPSPRVTRREAVLRGVPPVTAVGEPERVGPDRHGLADLEVGADPDDGRSRKASGPSRRGGARRGRVSPTRAAPRTQM